MHTRMLQKCKVLPRLPQALLLRKSGGPLRPFERAWRRGPVFFPLAGAVRLEGTGRRSKRAGPPRSQRDGGVREEVFKLKTCAKERNHFLRHLPLLPDNGL